MVDCNQQQKIHHNHRKATNPTSKEKYSVVDCEFATYVFMMFVWKALLNRLAFLFPALE